MKLHVADEMATQERHSFQIKRPYVDQLPSLLKALKPFKTTWKVKQYHVGGATSQAGVVYSLGYCLLFLTTLNFSLCFLLSPPSRPLVILSEHRSARAFFLLGGLFFCPTVAKCFVKRTMRPKSCCRYINKTELKLNWIIMWISGWLIIAFTQNKK